MFTGIVTETGEVVDAEPTATGRRLVLSAPRTAPAMDVGGSVAVDGVCLTAVGVDGDRVTVDAVTETLARTTLGDLGVGDAVDLEPAMPVGGRYDGHLVQGHVDGVGRVVEITGEGDARRVRVSLPTALTGYVVEKGSVAVDGVSLTVTAAAPRGDPEPWLEVVLIPHTLTATVLDRRRVGSAVNLEMDVIAKYVERMLEGNR